MHDGVFLFYFISFLRGGGAMVYDATVLREIKALELIISSVKGVRCTATDRTSTPNLPSLKLDVLTPIIVVLLDEIDPTRPGCLVGMRILNGGGSFICPAATMSVYE